MRTSLHYKEPQSILNKGTGFLSGYTHSLNPYAGCAFACSFCYVRQMPVSLFRQQEWGTWVDVKQGAAEVLRRQLRTAKKKGPVTIFMSSSTDPYQPAEHKEGVTRSLLETMVEEPPDFLLVQTRSPLITRDIDLLKQLGERVRVSMTIETDRDDMRKLFSPSAPPIAARLRALTALSEEGIATQAAIAPLLPSSENFPRLLRQATGRVCIDDYFNGDGSGGKRTQRLGLENLYRKHGLSEWYHPDALQTVIERIRGEFRDGEWLVSQEGFEP
ncbi:radical SAM protein [Paenibacillus sp. 1011MAR3C5]|uniref:SPL family radical SAM protein n=1 Tax=Paenibacillus sp. 1011MAR3C5 TaxID=1675787 RepID=UPI000E6B8D49|nr:radical SAM protein [Paenibacillus sp. 1011MAR3C5]RJE82607.1 radical SAM protein [Paenibacillus sp. 1011MAR3C5]